MTPIQIKWEYFKPNIKIRKMTDCGIITQLFGEHICFTPLWSFSVLSWLCPHETSGRTGKPVLSWFGGNAMLNLSSFHFKGLNKQYNFKMVKLKSVQLQHCILNPQICELSRSLKNPVRLEMRATENGKNTCVTRACIKSSNLCVRIHASKLTHHVFLLPSTTTFSSRYLFRKLKVGKAMCLSLRRCLQPACFAL